MWAFCLMSFRRFEVDRLNTVNRFKLIIFANCITKISLPQFLIESDLGELVKGFKMQNGARSELPKPLYIRFSSHY